jgi:hypothetical protein
MSQYKNKPPREIPVYPISKHDFIVSTKGYTEKEKCDDSWDIYDLIEVNDYSPEEEEYDRLRPTHFIESKVSPDDIPF